MLHRTVLVMALVAVTSSARADPAWRTWTDPPTVVDARQPEEVAAKLARDALGAEILTATGALESSARKAAAQLDAIEAKIDAALVVKADMAPGGAAPAPTIQKPNAFAIGGNDLEGIVLSGLVKFAERRAREEAIRIVMERLDATFCAKGKPGRSLFVETCALLGGFHQIAGMAPLSLLQRALHRDVAALPARLLPIAESLRAKAHVGPLVCGLQLGQRLERARSGSVGGLVVALTDALQTQDCGEALGFASRAAIDEVLAPVRVAAVLVAGLIQRGESYDAEAIAREAQQLLDSAGQQVAAQVIASADGDFRERGAAFEVKLRTALAETAGKPAHATIEALGTEGTKLIASIRVAEQKLSAQVEKVRGARLAPVQAALAPVARSLFPLAMALADRRRAPAADQAQAVGAILHGGADVVTYLFDVLEASGEASKASQRAALTELVSASADFLAGDFAGGMTGLLASGVVPADVEPIRTVLEMSELLLGIASAASSDEIASVLEASVPSGGWREKRHRTTYGLSAQFGAAGGLEWARGGGMSVRGGQIEAYLPVGFDVAGPLPHGFAGGLLLQVVDLGALSSTQLGSDSVDARPNVTVSSAFAPGASLYLGLGRTPFVLAVGASYVPGLRKMSDRDLDAVRVSVALAIDLPLLSF